MIDGKLRFHRRLAFQTGLAVAMVTVVVFGATGWVLVNDQEKTLNRELTRRILAETRSLSLAASAPLLRHDPELGLHPLIQKALKDNPDLVDLVVLDRQGEIQGHRDLLKVGSRLPVPTPAPDDLLHDPEGQRAWLEDDDLMIAVPIRHLDQPIGTLVARASRTGIQATVKGSVQRLATVAGAGTLLGILLVLSLVNRGLRPLGPMREGVRRIGEGDLQARIEVRQTNELGLFADLINSMTAGLASAQQDLIHKERMDHELAIAYDLQSTLLPRKVEAPDGFQLSAHYTPALEVSGDYYDVIPLGDGSLALVVADVSGKGVPGLVVMAMLRVILRGLSAPGRSPVEILGAANRMLDGSIKRDMFITCLYGVFHPQKSEFTYASAGHCRPARFGSGPAVWIEAGGKPLGMFPNQVFESTLKLRSVHLDPGDGLVMYTDGLVEAMDAAGNQLGHDAVLRELDVLTSGDAADAVDALRRRVESHRREHYATDDLTLLALRRQPAPAADPALAATLLQ